MTLSISSCLKGLILLQILAQSTALDPCSNYKWLKDSLYRGTNCPAIDNKELCDKYDINYNQWYRVKGDREMVTEKVEIFKCGTEFPIWLNGTLPKAGELVNTTACINEGLSVSKGACDKEMDIQILECTGYYVYNLQPPSTCNSAYCFGQGEACPAFEPCDFYYHDKIKTVDVNTLCKNPWKWFLVEESFQLPYECPENLDYALWINGTKLDLGEISPVTVCLKNGSSCCERFSDMNVKNCSGSLAIQVIGNNTCFFSGLDYNSSGLTFNNIAVYNVIQLFLCVWLSWNLHTRIF